MRVWTAYELSATISHKCGLGVTVIMHMRRAGQPMASHDLHLSSGDLAKSSLDEYFMNSSREIAGARTDLAVEIERRDRLRMDTLTCDSVQIEPSTVHNGRDERERGAKT